MLQNDLSQNVAIDFNTLTFGQLSFMVGASEGISRLPKVSQLRKQDEIAAEMNISQPMVHKHLEAAYARLREELLSRINRE